MFFGFNFTFFPQFILGYLGMPRRYHAYPPEFQPWNVMSSTGAVVLAAAYLMPLVYLTWCLLLREAGTGQPVERERARMADEFAPAKAQFSAHASGNRRPL